MRPLHQSASFSHMPAFEAQADEAIFDSDSRLTKTVMLDRFMPTLKGTCPYHFVAEGTVVPEHFPKCGYSATLHDDIKYNLFKQSFQFEHFHTASHAAYLRTGITTRKDLLATLTTPSQNWHHALSLTLYSERHFCSGRRPRQGRRWSKA